MTDVKMRHPGAGRRTFARFPLRLDSGVLSSTALPSAPPRAAATPAPSRTVTSPSESVSVAAAPVQAVPAETQPRPTPRDACSRPIPIDYAHVISSRQFNAWGVRTADAPSLLAAVRSGAVRTRSPLLTALAADPYPMLAHFNVESGLRNGSAAQPVTMDEGVRLVEGSRVRTTSYGIAQLHSPGLYRLLPRVRRLGANTPLPTSPPSTANASASFNWAPYVNTPAGLAFAVAWLLSFEDVIASHIDVTSLTTAQPRALDGAGSALLANAQAFCTDMPLITLLLRSFGAAGSISGMNSYLSGAMKRPQVTVRLRRQPTTEEARTGAVSLRDPAGPVRRAFRRTDPWWWRSLGALQRSWNACSDAARTVRAHPHPVDSDRGDS